MIDVPPTRPPAPAGRLTAGDRDERPVRPPPRRRVWAIALAGASAWHVVALLALGAWSPLATRPPAPRPEPAPIELVFPRVFTEQSPAAADEPPERPDFLSNVDARASDRVAGGAADAMPRQTGRADVPQVAMTRGEPTPPPSPAPRASELEPAPAEETATTGSGPGLLEASLRRRAQAQFTSPSLAAPSLDDLAQEATDDPLGNASLDGDIRLSTTAWDFAPWMGAFRRAVQDRWHAPPAYHIGLIHGWALIDVEIARSGEILRLEVVDDDVGHWSLTDAAVVALRYAQPFRPLPPDFPDETLVVRIRFSYPAFERAPARPPAESSGPGRTRSRRP